MNHDRRYRELYNTVKKSAKQDKENWIQQQCDAIENGMKVGNTRQAYKLVKMLKRQYVPKLIVIKDQDGTILQWKEDMMHRWTQYCPTHYDKQEVDEETLDQLLLITAPAGSDTEDILLSEVEEAITRLKKSKSPEADQITAEMIQGGGKPLV